MRTGFLKKLLVHGTETVVSVALVLAFFFVAMFLLGRALPQGTGLGDLMPSTIEPVSASITPVVRGGAGRPRPSGPQFVARLTDVYRKVKGKTATDIVWADASMGEMLENRHAVQTYDRSGAAIAFGDRSQVTLGENSLIVIRAREREREGESGGVSLLMTQGDLRTAFDGRGEGTPPLELASGRATTRLVPEVGPTDLRVTVNPDKSSTFTVYRGASDVQMGSESVRLHSNETITANATGPLGLPSKLPDVPSPFGPDPNAVVTYGSVPPRVRFAWSGQPGAERYHFEVARDREFRDVVFSERIDATEFMHGNLESGTYWWRVSSTLGWAESLPIAPRRLTVVEDRVAPELRVEFPAQEIDAATIVLHGSTERGATVFIEDVQIPIDEEGRFDYSVSLKRGSSVIVVEALDSAGNTTYRSGVLNARY